MRFSKLLVGGCAALFASGTAHADLSFFTVLDDTADVAGVSGNTYYGLNNVVAGNNGTVAAIAYVGADLHVTLNTVYGSANAEIVTSGLGLVNVTELSMAAGKLTFLGESSLGKFDIYQAPFGQTPVAIAGETVDPTYSLKVESQTDLINTHYAINNNADVAYKYTTTQVEGIRTTSDLPLSVITGDSNNFSDFVFSGPLAMYKRPTIAADGSLVFHAYKNSAYNIFRIDPTFTFYTEMTDGSINDETRVLAASNTAVLYATFDGTDTTVKLSTNGVSQSLVSYTGPRPLAGALPANAVMTDNNKAAFFTPLTDNESAALYTVIDGSLTQLATFGTTVGAFQIAGLPSSSSQGYSNPMINTAGTVVFDAVLDDDSDAILASIDGGPLTIVAKVGDTINIDGTDRTIAALNLDFATDAGGDVLKDGLSDDNWLAFGVVLDLGNDEFRTALVSVQLPEPASMSLLGLSGAMLLRRRRRGG